MIPRLSGASLAALSVSLLLAALSLVTWRQSRALERLEELDRLQREVSLLTAERNELESRIQILESRAHVVQEARERLGMRTASENAGEIVLLPGATP